MNFKPKPRFFDNPGLLKLAPLGYSMDFNAKGSVERSMEETPPNFIHVALLDVFESSFAHTSQTTITRRKQIKEMSRTLQFVFNNEETSIVGH